MRRCLSLQVQGRGQQTHHSCFTGGMGPNAQLQRRPAKLPVLHDTVATSQVWLLSTGNVAREAEEPH